MDRPSNVPGSGSGSVPASLTRRDIVSAGTGLLAAPLLLRFSGAPASAAMQSTMQGQPTPPAGGRGGSGPGNAPAGATAGAAAADAGRPAELINPLEMYPKPPFPKQEQEWPGLTSKMQPRPDHGERSYRGSGQLAGRKALITGGDSGIGRAAAIAYAREGADIAINYLDIEQPDADEVIELIRAEGRKVVPMPGDLRDEAFCRRLVADAAREMGGLDVLVINAARQTYQASLSGISTQQLDDTFRTNIYAMVWMTQAAMEHLKPGSSIICTASIVAYDPPEGLVDYSMTKAAIVNFVKSMNKQLAPKGVRINAVAPGPIWTPLQPSGGQDPAKVPQFGADTPLKRPGQPAELAASFVVLASNASSYVSGEVYGVTGGNPTG